VSLAQPFKGGPVNVGNQSEDRGNEQSQFGSYQEKCQMTGETARYSGLYLIEHSDHSADRAKKEILVVKGSVLPRCSACNEPLRFYLLRRVDHIAEDPDFN
jgi:hypothetical protein